MEKVLLAIDGINPDRKVLNYAVELCRRIKAELNILHLLDLRVYHNHIKKMQKGLHTAKKIFEDSMMAATFAEVGEHGTARKIMSEASSNMKTILPEDQQKNLDYQLKITAGSSAQEIIDYVNEHRDVVLAIYNPPMDSIDKEALRVDGEKKKHQAIGKKMQRKLSVPLVVIDH